MWRLSLRHCKTSKFKLRHRRGLIGLAPFVAGMSVTRELRRRMRGLGSLLGQSKEYPNPHWIALVFHNVARMQNCDVQRAITVSASLANRSAFNRAVFIASGASFGFIFRHRRSTVLRALFLFEFAFCPSSNLIWMHVECLLCGDNAVNALYLLLRRSCSNYQRHVLCAQWNPRDYLQVESRGNALLLTNALGW
jgi:hypothetical protein